MLEAIVRGYRKAKVLLRPLSYSMQARGGRAFSAHAHGTARMAPWTRMPARAQSPRTLSSRG